MSERKSLTKDRLIQLLQDSPLPGDAGIWIRSGSGQEWPAFAVIKEGPWGIHGDNPAHLTITDQNEPSYNEPTTRSRLCDALEELGVRCSKCNTLLPRFEDQRLGFAPPGQPTDAQGFWTEVSYGKCPNGCNEHLVIEL